MSPSAAAGTASTITGRGSAWARLLGGFASLVCLSVLIGLVARSALPIVTLVIVPLLGLLAWRSPVSGALLLLAITPLQSLGLRRLSVSPVDAVLFLIFLKGTVSIARGSRPREIFAWPTGPFGLAAGVFLFVRMATGIVPAARLASDFLEAGMAPGSLSIAQAIFSGTSNPLGEFWHHAAVVLLLLLLARRPLIPGRPHGLGRVVVPVIAVLGVVSIVERVIGARWGYDGLERIVGLAFTWGRIPGFFSWPTQLATYLDLVLPIALALAVVRERGDRGPEDGPRRSGRVASLRGWSDRRTVWFSIAAALGIIALFLALTRSGWLGLLLSSVTVIVLAMRGGESRRRLVAATALLALVLIPLTFQMWKARTDTQSLAGGNAENGGRTEYIWPTAIRMIEANPVFGCGLGTWRTASAAYAPHPLTAGRPEHVHAHNIFLQVGAESGIPAVMALLFLLAVTARGLWRRSRGGDPLWIGLAATLPGYLAHGLFEDSFFPPDLFLCFWVFLILAMARWDVPLDRFNLASSRDGGLS